MKGLENNVERANNSFLKNIIYGVDISIGALFANYGYQNDNNLLTIGGIALLAIGLNGLRLSLRDYIRR